VAPSGPCRGGRSRSDRLRLRLRYPGVPDFEVVPGALALPAWAASSAADYWGDKKLSPLADLDDEESFEIITRRINGGMNGWEDRLARRANARAALGLA
jgi:putative chitinase